MMRPPSLADSNRAGDRTNFESLYSHIADDPDLADLRCGLEGRICDYFAAMELPTEPTVYDHLILSLRGKDVIATFNWDPASSARAQRTTRRPSPGTLSPRQRGDWRLPRAQAQRGAGNRCPRCAEPLHPTPLLFPVANKDYATDPYIAAEWRNLDRVMAIVKLPSRNPHRPPRQNQLRLICGRDCERIVAWRPWRCQLDRDVEARSRSERERQQRTHALLRDG